MLETEGGAFQALTTRPLNTNRPTLSRKKRKRLRLGGAVIGGVLPPQVSVSGSHNSSLGCKLTYSFTQKTEAFTPRRPRERRGSHCRGAQQSRCWQRSEEQAVRGVNASVKKKASERNSLRGLHFGLLNNDLAFN
jgi:hypothetical protein